MKVSDRLLLIALCSVIAAVSAARADHERSFAAFIDAQGTISVFAPPVPDYV